MALDSYFNVLKPRTRLASIAELDLELRIAHASSQAGLAPTDRPQD
jgi:hypothetical protein